MCKGGIQIIILFFSVCFSISMHAQEVGDYRTKATGNWTAAATWETWNGSAWVESGFPTSENGVITILNGHTVTVTANVTVDQVVIEAGGQVTLSGGTLTVSNGPGDDFVILGTYRRISTFTTIFVNSGAVVRCANGGIYEHALAASGGSIPSITWEDESIFRLLNSQTTSVSPSGLNQSFGIVEINRPGQTTTVEDITFGDVRNELRVISTGTGRSRWNSAFSISGSYVQTGGAIDVRESTGSSNFDVGGNFSLDGGTFRITAANGEANAVTLNVDGNFTMSGGTFIFCATGSTSGPAFASIKGNVTISGGSFAGGFLREASGFYFNGQSSEQTLTFGLSLSSGVLDRFYYRSAAGGPTGLNEIYNGTSAQNTITGTGAAPGAGWSAWPTTGSLIKNLTIDNAEGVTLSTAKTVNNTLSLVKGVLNLPNALTLADDAHLIRSTGSLSAAPTFGGLVNVTYAENETATTTGPELPVNTSTLKDLTVNSEVILNAAVSVNGNLLLNATLNLNNKTITCSHNITTSTDSRIVGTGTLGGVGITLINNGTIAPGNSIGTISVEGNYTATGDAKHEFQIDGTQNDKLIVTGTATLAGSLTVTDITEEEDSTLETYTFIEGGTVEGEFGNITIPDRFVVNSDETGIFQLVLPVELISFTAREKPQGVWLQWSTASEQDSDYFQIERSSDGKTWEPLGRVVAAGQSNVVRNYEFLDKTPLFGWQYYRLLQKDWDGTSAYYGPVSLFSNAAAGSLEVYPTVFVDQLNLKMQARGQQSIQFTIRNAMGQVLEQGFLATNGQETTLETGAWPAGGYFVQIYTAQKTLKTLKIFKIQ
jgi:hypothetical protein